MVVDIPTHWIALFANFFEMLPRIGFNFNVFATHVNSFSSLVVWIINGLHTHYFAVLCATWGSDIRHMNFHQKNTMSFCRECMFLSMHFIKIQSVCESPPTCSVAAGINNSGMFGDSYVNQGHIR